MAVDVRPAPRGGGKVILHPVLSQLALLVQTKKAGAQQRLADGADGVSSTVGASAHGDGDVALRSVAVLYSL